MSPRLLLQPKWLTIRNRASTYSPGRGARWFAIAGVSAGFWWGVYAVLARILRYLRDIPDLGPLLAGKLLGMILIGFFGILLLSNVITALWTFFLARDLDLLVASPVPWPALYTAKVIETLVNSSWMVALMVVPLAGSIHSSAVPVTTSQQSPPTPRITLQGCGSARVSRAAACERLRAALRARPRSLHHGARDASGCGASMRQSLRGAEHGRSAGRRERHSPRRKRLRLQA